MDGTCALCLETTARSFLSGLPNSIRPILSHFPVFPLSCLIFESSFTGFMLTCSEAFPDFLGKQQNSGGSLTLQVKPDFNTQGFLQGEAQESTRTNVGEQTAMGTCGCFRCTLMVKDLFLHCAGVRKHLLLYNFHYLDM